MTKNVLGPDEPAMELNEETVADLDTVADPAGGRMALMSSAGKGRCLTDDDDTCWDNDPNC